MAKQQYRDGKPPHEAGEPTPLPQEQIDFYSKNADQLRIDLHKHVWVEEAVSANQVMRALDYVSRSVEKSLPMQGRAVKEKHIDAVGPIAKSLQSGKLVLVLGAGVSMGFGLPDWPTLLQKLMITTLEEEPDVSSVLSNLFSAVFAPSAVMAGRYLQKFYEDKEESFEEAVRKALYENLNIQSESALMDEIMQLCVAPGRSPALDSIITYNFDDLLEQRIARLDVDLPYKAIYTDGMHAGNRLPIYHVHGYLPSEGPIDDQNRITLGESVYHRQYTDIYSWSNIVQINKFTEFDCLFIGSSLTDPNIRRLLDVAYRQRGEREEKHHVFKRRVRPEEVRERLQLILKNNSNMMTSKVAVSLDFDKAVDYLCAIIERFEESDTESFGVETIWVDDFKEIPEMLAKVRQRAR